MGEDAWYRAKSFLLWLGVSIYVLIVALSLAGIGCLVYLEYKARL